MGKNEKITLAICFIVYAVLALIILATQGHDAPGFIGLTGVLLAVVYMVFGLIALISKESRNIGAALLISGGIIFLIGFSICSVGAVKM